MKFHSLICIDATRATGIEHHKHLIKYVYSSSLNYKHVGIEFKNINGASIYQNLYGIELTYLEQLSGTIPYFGAFKNIRRIPGTTIKTCCKK